MNYNLKSRTQNAINNFMFSIVGSIVNAALGLIYRSFFLHILSVEYFGIDGLFTNVLSVLSIAELGITNSIMFRLYKPIRENDVGQISQILSLLKTAYRMIMLFILGVGVAILPVLKYLVNDVNEIPGDVNLYVVYGIFLFQTLSSYFFNYRQIILSADQKQYVITIGNLVKNCLKYLIQIIVLLVTRAYVLSLLAGSMIIIISNFVMSFYATRTYGEAMAYRGRIDRKIRDAVLSDVKATAMHCVGGKIVTSTDSIVISKCVSLAAVGLYSNYSFIIVNLESVISQALGVFVSSIGSANVALSKDENYRIFKKLQYVGLCIGVVTTVCLYVLTSPFIRLWLGEEMLLGKGILILLCMDYYWNVTRQICLSFTNATGLFIKDRFRPLIQSVVNLGVSIVLAKHIGLAGVFIGTLVSYIVTVFWREPAILFKDYFCRSSAEYWLSYVLFVFVTILDCLIVDQITENMPQNILGWIITGIIAVIISVSTIVLFTFKSDEYRYFFDFIKKKIRRI